MADQGHAADLLWTSDIMLELLGPVRLVSSAGDDLTPKSRKTRALLALLALSKSPLPRSRLTDLLWGDRGEDQAKASLRQALYELRSLASRGFITADRHSIGLGPKKLPTDVAAIQQLVADKDAAGLVEGLETVERPILETLDDLTPELDDWLRDERGRVCSSIISGALALAEESLHAGDPAIARRLADQLEGLDPLNERITQVGIRADLAAGEKPAAVRRHARLAQRLKTELEIEPSSETTALLNTASVRTDRGERTALAAAPSRRRFRWLLPLAIALSVIAACRKQ